jgi:hypothetical protein
MNNRYSLDSRLARAFGKVVGNTTRRPRALRPHQIFEHLEARCLLAVTTTQGLPVVGVEGAEFGAPTGGVVAKFTSDDVPEPLSNFSASIVWGDGHTTAIADIVNDPVLPGVFDVLGTNTYAEEGTYPVTVSIHDAPPLGVASDAVAASVATIADAPITATGIPTPPVLPAGQIVAGVPTFSGTVATFKDANPAGALADFTATINWGDGVTNNGVISGPVAGVFSVTGAHTFAPGSYPVSVFIQDVGGASATAVTTFTITGTTPVVAPISPATLTEIEGKPFTAPIGAFTDPNLIATTSEYSATINWGDATTSSGTVSQLATGTFIVTGSHAYAEDTTGAPPQAVTFTVKEAGGGTLTGAAGVSITVADAPLSSQGASIQPVEGVPFVGTLVATVTDSNPAATIADFTTGTGSVTINWGDGTSSTLTSVPPAVITASGSPAGVVFSITGSHTYAEEGSFQVTVTADDKGGSTTIASGQATVADAPLSSTGLVQPVIITEEATVFPIPQFGTPVFTGPVAVFSDLNTGATIADYTATIDWGDGTPPSTGTIVALAPAGTFEVSGSHTYATSGVNGGNGTFRVQTQISDVGGSKLTVANTATVIDDPLSVNGILNPSSDSGKNNQDAITNVAQPNFYGTVLVTPLVVTPFGPTPVANIPLIGASFAHVTLFANGVAVGSAQADGAGHWSITSNLLAQGTYAITASATDQFGQTVSPTATIVPALVVDTAPPVITSLSFNRFDATLSATFQDNLSGMDLASLTNSAFYHISARPLSSKVHVPATILPTSISFTPGALPSDPVAVSVVFNKGRAFRGGKYEVIINSGTGDNGIQDVAGNALDGNFYGPFPTGDGLAGGTFVAQISTFHNVVLPFVPIADGYVPPPAGIDPPAGSSHSGATHKVAVAHKANEAISAAHHAVQKTRVHDAAIRAHVIDAERLSRRS